MQQENDNNNNVRPKNAQDYSLERCIWGVGFGTSGLASWVSGSFNVEALGLWPSTCKVRFSRCRAGARDAWQQAACISLFTILLLFTVLLFYHSPNRLHLTNRAVSIESGFY